MTLLKPLAALTLVSLVICLLSVSLTHAVGRAFPPRWTILYAHRVSPQAVDGWWMGLLETDRHLVARTQRGFANWEGIYPSPDGRSIAGYVTQVAGDALVLYDPSAARDGMRFVGQGFTPAWSPDGRTLAFIAYDGGLLIAPISPDGIPGQPLRLLTAAAAQDLARSPRWSPDGRTLAYLLEGFAGVQRDKAEIYIRPVTTDVATGAASPASAQAPRLLTGHDPDPVRDYAWSPDGEWLIFATYDGSESRLHQIAPDRPDDRRTLGRLRAVVRGLRWSPDGQQVAFYAITPTDFAVYVVKVDDADTHPTPADAAALPRLLATLTPDINQPIIWSPDSAHLAFVGIDDGQVYTVAATAGTPASAGLRRITDSIRRFVLLR